LSGVRDWGLGIRIRRPGPEALRGKRISRSSNHEAAMSANTRTPDL
jgi:hypothetical protein